MISMPLDDAYFEWLYSQVGTVRLKHSSTTYWNLFRILYQKEFVWFVPNDDNRAEDGRSLRYEFIEEMELDPRRDRGLRDWFGLPCSFLEMLIGLSRRLAFEDGGGPADWFWHLIETLDLKIYADNIHIPVEKVQDILDRVIWRTYRRDGQGGLFPLRHAREDQREVEIWYQLSAYLLEQQRI